jgi:hypothetical protein
MNKPTNREGAPMLNGLAHLIHRHIHICTVWMVKNMVTRWQKYESFCLWNQPLY